MLGRHRAGASPRGSGGSPAGTPPRGPGPVPHGALLRPSRSGGALGGKGSPVGRTTPGQVGGRSASPATALGRRSPVAAAESSGDIAKRSEVDSVSLVWSLAAELPASSILGHGPGAVNSSAACQLGVPLPGRGSEIPVTNFSTSGRCLKAL
ncbi:unnamed protein product [Prorocentrum cordatum]|uniref:Uncharacterized protein n=1 Tax=Prorocentrum cordatum TaxID=2364126 RepID=A0ABN9WZW9_9DINO|nr:unnamed protein product [Polarella glacialis]